MYKGKHLLIDCRNVSSEVCLDDRQMLDVMARAATKAGSNVISQVRYHFGHNSPPGFTTVVLLDESHVSAHCYADTGQLALDIFTCGTTDPREVLDFIREEIDLGDIMVKEEIRFSMELSPSSGYSRSLNDTDQKPDSVNEAQIAP
ncbi:MAG: adenosylmethionine decarboxylase [Pirellulales bacterium]|nr:adenosylmethionine decarboxylase [Pirellulales bacterium]